MAEINNDVLNMVVDEMRSTPKPDAKVLLARAQQMDPSLKSMSVFAFSGKYMGTAKKVLAGRGRATKSATKSATRKGTAKRTAAKQPTAKKAAAKQPVARKQTAAPAAAARKTTTKRARRVRSAPRQAVAASTGRLEGEARKKVRDILVSFGKEISVSANNPQKLIDIMAGVENRLDKIAEVIGA